MKKSEIKIGHIYSNGKGRLRKVIDIGPQYKLYDGQRCDENMRDVYKRQAPGRPTGLAASAKLILLGEGGYEDECVSKGPLRHWIQHR